MTGAVALYMRLSAEDANIGESVSIANQRDLLYAFVRSRREFDGCPVLEFCDDGYSGVNFSRPSVQKLLSLAGKTVSCIIVKDFSRFGRNLIEVGDYLDQIFPFLGVRFIAVNEGYDSGEGHGSSVSLDVSLKAMVYEMYSYDISEKIRCVQQAKMRKGEYLCAIAFYGYQRSKLKKNHLEIDTNAAEVVRRIFNMAVNGMVPSKIASELNREGILSPLMYRKKNHTDGIRGWKTAGERTYWTRENVRRIICDERYTGCLIGRKRTVVDISTKRTEPVPREDWIVAENTHEALVTKEIYTQAQRVLKTVKQRTLPRKPYQKFRGLLKCACCKRTLWRTACKAAYYSCPTARTVDNDACSNVYLEESMLEQALLTAIQIQVQLFQENVPKGEDKKGFLQDEIKECQSVINRCRTRYATLFEDYAEGCISKREYLSKKQEIFIQQEEARSRFEERSSQLAQIQREPEKNNVDLGKYAFVKELTREMLEELVKEVRVSEKDILEIKWNFQEPCSGNGEEK